MRGRGIRMQVQKDVGSCRLLVSRCSVRGESSVLGFGRSRNVLLRVTSLGSRGLYCGAVKPMCAREPKRKCLLRKAPDVSIDGYVLVVKLLQRSRVMILAGLLCGILWLLPTRIAL